MRVLIIHPSFWIYGGAERVIVKLANYLTDNNHQCTILTTNIHKDVRSDLKDTRLILVNGMEEMSFWIDAIHKDFDVINFHNHPAEIFAFGKKTPSVWLCNEPPPVVLDGGKLSEGEINNVKNFVTKVVVADKFNQDRFKKVYGVDSDIINYGVDYDFWNEPPTTDVLEKYDLPDDAFIITQAGFVHPMKNQSETLQVFNEVKKKIKNAKLVLAGKIIPEFKKELDDYIFANNLQADVIFTDFISQEELRDIYHDSDVAFFPIKSQGGWLSIFDAMACGKPVIVSEEATCSSIVKENNLGLVGNYVENILKLSNEEVVKTLDSSDWVKENLSWDKFCEAMLKKFEEVRK